MARARPATAGASDRLANTFAALAVAITDRVQLGLAARFGLGPSDASALVVLARTGRPIENLRQEIGLSHSAAVRLVDRLQAAGLAVRGPGRDKRSVSVRLTEAGRRRARAILAERDRIVSEALEPLDPEGRRLLAGAVERALEALAVDWRTAMHICRLCDIPGCEHGAACPVAVGAEISVSRVAHG